MSKQRLHNLNELLSYTPFVYDGERNRLIYKRDNGTILYLPTSTLPVEYVKTGKHVGDILMPIKDDHFFTWAYKDLEPHILNYDKQYFTESYYATMHHLDSIYNILKEGF